jgi:hypothetical protein
MGKIRRQRRRAMHGDGVALFRRHPIGTRKRHAERKNAADNSAKERTPRNPHHPTPI